MSFFKKANLILLLILLCVFSSCGFFPDESNTQNTALATSKATNKSTPVTIKTEAPKSTTVPTPDTRLKFTLSYNSTTEYGKKIVMNEGTEFEQSFIAFYLPAGTYSVKNKEKNGTQQVSIYSGIGNDGQWDELYDDNCDRPIVISAGGAAKTIAVKEGQFVKLSDGSSNIEFTKTE